MSELIVEDDRMRNQKSLIYKKTGAKGDAFYNFKTGEFELFEHGLMISDDCIFPLDINTKVVGGFFEKKAYESDIIVEIKKSKQYHVENLNQIIESILAKTLPTKNLGEL